MPSDSTSSGRPSPRPHWPSQPPDLPPVRKPTPLDKDLKRIRRMEEAVATTTGRTSTRIGLGLLFLIGVCLFAGAQSGGVEQFWLVVIAGVIAGYMALNIGANDVANNVSPAVGSQALTLTGALAIAAIFEAAGAIIAGGDVVATVSKGIVDPARLASAETLIHAMTAALLAAALWLNLATHLGAPVSTTHSIVGAVAGSGIAAAGADAVDWAVMGQIAASWVISPALGGVIAAAILLFVNYAILSREAKIAAAQRGLPILVAIMAAAFSVYLVTKGLGRLWKPGTSILLLIGVGAFLLAWAIVRPMVNRASQGLENRRKSVVTLFTVPLICAAALLSFAHGANDVANAVGPLAAIVSASNTGGVQGTVSIPFWVMLVGAAGIAVGLALFGSRLIRAVGTQITKLDRARAFAIALSAAVTVIVASGLGLPVSSTHITLGALFGVGFLRERLDRIRKPHRYAALAAHESEALRLLDPEDRDLAEKKGQKKARKAQKRKLVRRQHLLTIVAAWLITVPLTAVLSAGLYVFSRAVWAG